MAKRVYTFPEEVTLISKSYLVNGVGDTVAIERERVSFAEIVSPYMRETYEAMARGLKPEFVAVLPNWDDDYHGEDELLYNGTRYRVIRAYKTPDLTCELTVMAIRNRVPDSGTMEV